FFFVVVLIAWTFPAAAPAQYAARTGPPIVSSQIAHPHPNHAELHREYVQLQQGREFVAILRSRVGEPDGNLVFPPLLEPAWSKGGLQECLEYSRSTPHIRGAPEDDPVTTVEFGHQCFIREASFKNVATLDLQELRVCSLDCLDAFENRVGKHLGVPAIRLEDYCHACHGSSSGSAS